MTPTPDELFAMYGLSVDAYCAYLKISEDQKQMLSAFGLPDPTKAFEDVSKFLESFEKYIPGIDKVGDIHSFRASFLQGCNEFLERHQRVPQWNDVPQMKVAIESYIENFVEYDEEENNDADSWKPNGWSLDGD